MRRKTLWSSSMYHQPEQSKSLERTFLNIENHSTNVSSTNTTTHVYNLQITSVLLIFQDRTALLASILASECGCCCCSSSSRCGVEGYIGRPQTRRMKMALNHTPSGSSEVFCPKSAPETAPTKTKFKNPLSRKIRFRRTKAHHQHERKRTRNFAPPLQLP